MTCTRKNSIYGLSQYVKAFMLFVVLQSVVISLSAQGTKTANIKLTFTGTDSTKTCIAAVTSDSGKVKGKEVHLYVKSLYALLPIGKAIETDENGEASFNFPIDLPGDQNNMLVVVAKIEKDETYGTVETDSTVKWGALQANESNRWADRSLSASREKAPMFLVFGSNLIIGIIWGTILYIIFQLVRIRKAGKTAKAAANKTT
jgi:hypothetical protein